MATGKRPDDRQDPAGALNHELRRRILRLMSDGRRTSPRELADELGEQLSTTAYHVRILAACGAIRPAGYKQVRGARQNFYRWSLRSKGAREMLDEYEEADKEAEAKRKKKRKKRKKDES